MIQISDPLVPNDSSFIPSSDTNAHLASARTNRLGPDEVADTHTHTHTPVPTEPGTGPKAGRK